MSAMDRKIIINADDFGLCEGVNKAVADAHTKGVLTSTTIMANMPAAKEAVKIAKHLPNLGVGVHLNLTYGHPISRAPGLHPLLDSDGRFIRSPANLSLLSMLSAKIRNAIRTELAAQIQWVLDSGLKPTHLDSHKHIHCFPVLFPIVCSLARQFKITAIRHPFEPRHVSRTPWPPPSEGGGKRARLLRIMTRINRFQNSDFRRTDTLFGISHTGKIDVDFFEAVALYNREPIAEIMTHPGYLDGLDPTRTRLFRQRKVELDALCGEKTKQCFKNAGIKLVHYGQI